MRKHIDRVMIVLLLVFLFPLGVRAASGDGLRLDEGGNVTIVSQHAAKEGVSSLCFCLSVESADAARVEFQFGESGAKIKDFRYDETTGRLNVYLAGTEALFAQGADALTVGKIKVLDGSGNETNATVSAVENSLQYVYGTELKTMQGVELPEAVQIGPAAAQPEPPSDPQPPAATQTPVTPDPQPPAATQTPVTPDPQPPAATQIPVAQQPPTSQLPVAPQFPVAVPTMAPQLPVTVPTPGPAQTAGPTESPRPTEAPEDSSMENSQPPASQPLEDVPQLEEDTLFSSPLPVDGKVSEEDSKGVSIFVVIAVAAVLVVIAIEVMAFWVLKKPHGFNRRRRRGK